jgi:hypothetical protein
MIDSIIKYVIGIVRLRGATDGTAIGNSGDKLKVEVSTATNVPIDIELMPEHKDAFHNLIFVTPYTIWEGDHKYSKETEYWDETIVGGATSTHVAAYSSVKLSVGTAINDEVIRQTYRHFHYIKGNSQRILLTGNFSGLKAGVRRRYGYFNAYNGVFFETSGTTMNIVVRSDTSGAVVDTAVASTAWNTDRLDGSNGAYNPSGYTADPTKQQLFFIDFAWLGIGPIRFGIFIGDEPVIVHTVHSSNVIATSWARSAELPIRCEIKNVTSQATASDFYQTCCSVKSMGGQKQEGNIKVVDTGVTAVSLTSTEKVVAGIRLSATSIRGASIKPGTFSILPASGSVICYYKIILRPTLTSPTWSAFTDISDVLTNNPTYTGGIILSSGYFDLGTGTGSGYNVTSGTGGAVPIFNDKLLGYSIAGDGDALILVVRTISSTGSIYFSGNWEEFS